MMGSSEGNVLRSRAISRDRRVRERDVRDRGVNYSCCH